MKGGVWIVTGPGMASPHLWYGCSTWGSTGHNFRTDLPASLFMGSPLESLVDAESHTFHVILCRLTVLSALDLEFRDLVVVVYVQLAWEFGTSWGSLTGQFLGWPLKGKPSSSIQ